MTKSNPAAREQVLYAACGWLGKCGVGTFRITGQGELVQATPFFTKLPLSPEQLSLDNTGRQLIVYGRNFAEKNTTRGFIIGAKGRLMNPFIPARAELDCFVDVKHPSGRFGYRVARGRKGISQYRITPDGKIVPLRPAKAAENETMRSIAIDPRGRAAYALAESGLHEYKIHPNGTLAPFPPPPQGWQYDTMLSVVFHPSGKSVFIKNQDTIFQVSVLPNGRLGKHIGSVPVINHPSRCESNVLFNASGSHAFAIQEANPQGEGQAVEWSGPQPVIAKYLTLSDGHLRPAPSARIDLTKWGLFVSDILVCTPQ